jgi:hypothetical protein
MNGCKNAHPSTNHVPVGAPSLSQFHRDKGGITRTSTIKQCHPERSEGSAAALNNQYDPTTAFAGSLTAMGAVAN